MTSFKDFANFAAVRFRGSAIFMDVVFKERAAFTEGETFMGSGNFFGATFHNADFNGAVFDSVGGFQEVTFEDRTDFRNATLHVANFKDAKFKGQFAVFAASVFGPVASFVDARFETEAAFEGTTFEGEANFAKAHFDANVAFAMTTFGGNVYFSQATFGGDSAALFLGDWDQKMFNSVLAGLVEAME